MRHSIYALGAIRIRRKGQSCTLSTYNFSNSISCHLENGVSTQVSHLLFSEKFEQTQFGDLGTCPDI